MSMEELKEFIMEAAVEETLIIQEPIGEVDIQGMSAEELKVCRYIMDYLNTPFCTGLCYGGCD